MITLIELRKPKKMTQIECVKYLDIPVHAYQNYKTKHYIFTHGWIPCTPISISPYIKQYVPIENWRNADSDAWCKARWLNGMEAANAGVIIDGKTIVCGHWHCSFGHANYENDGGEFDNNPNFTPYYGNGIIALDACTIRSHKVNCIVIED